MIMPLSNSQISSPPPSEKTDNSLKNKHEIKVNKKNLSRGTLLSPDNRFENITSAPIDDGWQIEEPEAVIPTEAIAENCQTIVSSNQSPDIPFSQSINPYKGCEHGCIYCYARPSHEYWGFNCGLDFETKIIYKPNAAELLEKKFNSKNYQCEPIAIGANTDPYQPIDQKLRITRSLLEVCARYQHPIIIITKGNSILTDIDLLSQLAENQLVQVMISMTTMDNKLKAKMEPRAASPSTRLRIIRQLSQAGIPVGILTAPIIPFINDNEIESIVKTSAAAGASSADYSLIRLPHQLNVLFEDWLQKHFPDRADRVLKLIRSSREPSKNGGGSQSDFASRITGSGEYASLIAQRFHLALKKSKINYRHVTDNKAYNNALNTERFSPKLTQSPQRELFET